MALPYRISDEHKDDQYNGHRKNVEESTEGKCHSYAGQGCQS